ncbi:hypothetical protein PFISCL1PPCAC_7594, partial [Pristionchus fissidentatus]
KCEASKFVSNDMCKNYTTGKFVCAPPVKNTNNNNYECPSGMKLDIAITERWLKGGAYELICHGDMMRIQYTSD